MSPRRIPRALLPASACSALVVLLGGSPALADGVQPEQQPQGVEIRQVYEQGTLDQDVSVHGFVTADYSDRGIGGFYVQAPNTGGQPDPGVMMPQAVHVTGAGDVHVGDYVQITGTVRQTNSGRILETSAAKVVGQDAPEGDGAPKPITSLASIKGSWNDAATLDRISGMLVMPDSGFRVSGLDQYALRGEAAVTEGAQFDAARKDPSASGAQGEKLILDDGAADEYTANEETQNRVLPRWAGDRAPRIGDDAEFTGPSILEHVAATPGLTDGWHVQPTSPVTDPGTPLPARVKGTAPSAEITAPSGDLSVAQVDLGNYFSVTADGADTSGADCSTSQTADGTALAVLGGGGCPILGAADGESFARQNSKVEALLSGMKGVDVISVQGLQNDAQIGKEGPSTAEDLAGLLNESGDGEWKAVAAPQGAVGPRSNGFLYRADAVEPTGETRISTDKDFYSASSPVAQTFRERGGTKAEATIVSTRFSGQSTSDYDGDLGQDRLAGQNAEQRSAQAGALTSWLDGLGEESLVVTGNLGSLDGDAPVTTIARAGFTDLVAGAGAPTSQGTSASGNQTHVFMSSKLAKEGKAAAKVWNVSAQSAPAAGYADFGLNGSDLVDLDSPERATAENPVVFSVDLPRATSDDKGSSPRASVRSAPDSEADTSTTKSPTDDTEQVDEKSTEKTEAKQADAKKATETEKTETEKTEAEKPEAKKSDAKQTAAADSDAASAPSDASTSQTSGGSGAGGAAPASGGSGAASKAQVSSSTGSGDSAPSSSGTGASSASSGTKASAKSDAKKTSTPPASDGSQAGSTADAKGSGTPTGSEKVDPAHAIQLGQGGQLDSEGARASVAPADSAVVRAGLVILAIALAVGAAVAIAVRRRRSS
ncbi:hypothetical protein Bra3105_15145 [Brachybacterium halotolerans subsp. kimchii]|uniref:hypothetical protein n=1 Tax=Brachybacterium halotolerans TaxID=2795215 RepID=UPI001E3397DE|nr:hypothetical protein [Brachybacterium halotolerans]UEJ82160.1 hypothetical protein Bra3105_15145 [Brachybacterium halotolerans subsp. kimchii]